MNPKKIFAGVETILVIDWPSREVPENLAIAGFQVIVGGGPAPEDYAAYEVTNGMVVACRLSRPPEHADLVYSYRPLSELPEIVATAQRLHARTIWTQSGFSALGIKERKGCWFAAQHQESARNLVQSAGLNYLSAPYMADVVRELTHRPD